MAGWFEAVPQHKVPVLVGLLLIGLGIAGLLLFAFLTRSDIGELHSDSVKAHQALDRVYTTAGDSETRRAVILRLLSDTRKHWPLHTVGTHLSVALISAGVLILVVEIHTRKKLREEVDEDRKAFGRDVWRAFSDRLIPRPIATELESLLKERVCWHDARYRVTVFKDPPPQQNLWGVSGSGKAPRV